MPLSLGISYVGLSKQRIKAKSPFLEFRTYANSWAKTRADPHVAWSQLHLQKALDAFFVGANTHMEVTSPRRWGNAFPGIDGTWRSWNLFNKMKMVQASDTYLTWPQQPGDTLYQPKGHCWIQILRNYGASGGPARAVDRAKCLCGIHFMGLKKLCVTWPQSTGEADRNDILITHNNRSGHFFATHKTLST